MSWVATGVMGLICTSAELDHRVQPIEFQCFPSNLSHPRPPFIIILLFITIINFVELLHESELRLPPGVLAEVFGCLLHTLLDLAENV